MDSLRTIHARVAALTRFRGPADPEVATARAELARCLEETRALRSRLSSTPPDAWTLSEAFRGSGKAPARG